ncbi:MAG: hypothetical protein GXO39_03065 [Thermotogae bacterium]|nr:hypothetical protein [Thermotogota bacterium]
MFKVSNVRRLEEYLKHLLLSGTVPKDLLKVIAMFHFFNMDMGKTHYYIRLWDRLVKERDEDIEWLKFMLKFLAFKPLDPPQKPIENFYYTMYYLGDFAKAYRILYENEDYIRARFSQAFLHSLYLQVFNFLGRMYVLPKSALKGDPSEIYGGINRAFTGDLLALRDVFRSKRFPFLLSHPFSKRLAIIGRMVMAIMEEDFLTYEILLKSFQKEGEKLLYLAGRILGSIFDPAQTVREVELPDYAPFFRKINRLVRKGFLCNVSPKEAGIQSFLWHAYKVKDKRKYISFGGRLRVVQGLEEVKLPRRKALIILGIERTLGTEGLRSMASHIFPHSPKPMKTVYDYMRFIREFRHSPSNLRFTLYSGSFLYDETEPWAMELKDKLKRAGRLKKPIIGRP